MSKKSRILSYLFFCFIIGFCVIFKVNADIKDNYSIGSNSDIGSCKNNWHCYSGSVGFRVTLVDKETGERCNYSNSGGTYNLCDGSTKTVSKDYWFNKSQIKNLIDASSSIDEKLCRAYSTKETKAEHITNDDYNKNIGNCSEVYTDYKQLDDLFINYTNSNWEGASCNDKGECKIEPDRNPKNMKYVRDWFNDLQNNKGDATAIAAVLSATTGKAITADDINQGKVKGLDKINIQFEQLLAISNYNAKISNGKKEYSTIGIITIGTVAESTYLYMNDTTSGITDGSGDRWCTINGKKLNGRFPNFGFSSPLVNSQNCGSSMFAGGYWTGWYASSNIGSGDYALSATADPVSVVDKIDSYLVPYDDSMRVNSNMPIKSFYKYRSTANIYSVSISEKFTKSCDKDARTKPDQSNNVNEWRNYLKANYADYEDTARSSNKINIFEARNDYINTGIDDIVTDNFIGNDANYCKTITCDEILKKMRKTEKNLNILYNTFPKNDFLNPEVLKELGDTSYSRASCESTPNCPVDPKVFKCDYANGNGNSLTLSDSTARNSNGTCISQGIAYNGYTENNTFHKEAVQSSYDSEYGTPGDPGYCSEKVTFDFPGNASATAGKLLKWGKIEDDQEFREFGTMTVSRTCYLSNSKKQFINGKVTITSDWADVIVGPNSASGAITANGYGYTAKNDAARINPEIKLTYVQAVPEKYRGKINNYRVEKNLKVYLSDFYMSDNKTHDENVVSYDINGNVVDDGDNPNPRTTTVYESSNSRMIDSVNMTATYKIVYGNDLYWYSDKSNQFALTTTNDEDAMAQNPSYVALGYGLPTSFLTPSTPIDKHYGYALNSSESGGKLSVSVSQIGTQNSTGGKYHFDKMITYALDDDDNDNNDKIVYSCGFDIKNELFGYECGDHGENCDNTCTNPPCDSPKGIDVVFRTVDLVSSEEDLTMAFPGRSGKGRQRGKNWAELDDEEVVDILNNNIYNNTPIYEINLNSSLIQNIRLANKNMRAKGNDPYSDMTLAQGNGSEGDGYQGYTYYQSKGDNKFAKCMEFFSFFTDSTKFRECMSSPSESESSSTTGPVASNFIKHLIDKGSLTGRCATQSDNSRRIENILSGCEG